MNNRPQAERQSIITATGGSFEQELRELLQKRTRLAMIIALLVAASALLVSHLLQVPPTLPSGLARHQTGIRLFQVAVFLAGLSLTYVIKGSARQFQLLVFWIIVVSMTVAMFLSASVATDEVPYLAASLALFIYAVFIPSPARYPIMLGVTAVAAFVLSATLTFAFVPEAHQFWVDIGAVTGMSGVSALRNHILLGTTGLAILAFVAHVASRTLYSLRIKTHEASRMGSYVIEEELGSGGMGQVFRATHALIRRPTAVKVMRVSGEQGLAALQRFEREVQLSAALTHPNTITIYDFGRTPDNRFYYAMEYLEGVDLENLVARFGPLDPGRAVYVISQACSSLSEAHTLGIVHRDIKPSNIFLTHRGGLYDFVKVLDFGLAKQVTVDEGPGITKTGIAVGTPRYISPEAAQGHVMDGRSDLYCLGAVAYFTLTGRPPFQSGSSVELLIDHMKAVPRRPSQVSELPIPPALDDIIMKCLEKKPEDRFPSAADLEAALNTVPLQERWDQQKARAWWDLHGLGAPEPVSLRDDGGLSNRGISEFIYEP